MAKRLLQKTTSNSAGRLRRGSEKPECTGRPRELPLANLIVIGTSAGGHKALWDVVSGIPHNIPAAVIIMQHMASHQTSFRLDAWLRDATRVPIAQIQSGDRLRSSAIYVCPPGMSVSLKGRTLRLTPQERDGPISTINIMFKSAASAFHDRVIGVVLTGLLRDGTDGLRAVHDAGGVTIVQDPAEAEFPDMPTSAMKDLPVTFCLKLADIGPTLDLLARRKSELEPGLSVSVRLLQERVALLIRLIAQSKHNTETQHFLATELGALEHDLGSIQTLVNKALAETGKIQPAGARN